MRKARKETAEIPGRVPTFLAVTLRELAARADEHAASDTEPTSRRARWMATTLLIDQLNMDLFRLWRGDR